MSAYDERTVTALRRLAATQAPGDSWQADATAVLRRGRVLRARRRTVTATAGALVLAVAIAVPATLAHHGTPGPVSPGQPTATTSPTSPPTTTPTLSLGTPPATPAPGPAQLAVGVESARGLSSRAGDLAAVDATVTGEYYLAGDLGGASVRIGVSTAGAPPQFTVFAVSTAGTTVSPTAPPTWAPATATIPESWARFPDDKVHSFTTGITPAGAPRVFLVATWGFDLTDGSHVYALEVPTFAPPAAVAAALAPDQRMWAVSDAGAPQSVGSGWSGYVYASSDGTIVDPSCAGASVPQDSCARGDLDFGAYAEIRAALTK